MSLPEAVRMIQQALDKGNYGRADLLGRQMLESLPDYPWSPLLLAMTALRIGEHAAAWDWCRETDLRLARHPAGAHGRVETELRALRMKLDRAEPARRVSADQILGLWPVVGCRTRSIVAAPGGDDQPHAGRALGAEQLLR